MALASHLPIAWVTGDCVYGQEWRMRRALEAADVGYVLAVPKSQQVHAVGRIDFAIAQAPEEAWERISYGDGAKGPRVYDWAAARLPAIADFDGDHPTHQRWVLARGSLARPDEIAYWLAYAPSGTTVETLVRIAGVRWTNEECFQAAKSECELDQYAVAATRAGTSTSPWPCLPMPSSPPWPQRHRKGAEEAVTPPCSLSPCQRCGASWTLPAPATSDTTSNTR
ncbi:hypothetical protein BKA18_006898 [Streptomyces auratus]